MKKIIILLPFLLLINLLFSTLETELASKNSIVPFQILSNSKPMFHIGGLQDSLSIQFFSGFQINPTSNLLLGGILSPKTNNSNLSIYYHISIGYIPEWRLINKSNNIIQVGMHRNRFNKENDSRWFSLSFTKSIQFSNYNINLCWNKLFTQTWERNTLLISTKLKILNELYCQSGLTAYFTPNLNYSPFLLFSIKI